MGKKVTQGTPKSIYVIIVVFLVSMFSYAIFLDTPAAEKTVEDFYQAYFTKDYDTVAKNLSVFWSVQFLPQYHNHSPKQLIEERAEIEKEIAQIIAQIEGDAKYPEGLHIEVNSKLTKQTTNSALVGYTFWENDVPSGMEVAILINENGAYRIFSMAPANPADMENISDENLQILDDDFKSLLELE
ncbi:MAG TPA: hypothetical protein VFC73_05365 [Syntrophomonadaceae bacterium]|nr:hypothetical protein [Syntrophomonadaceae bacterium]